MFLVGLVVIVALLFARANAVASAVLGTGGGPALSGGSDRVGPVAQPTQNGEAGLEAAVEPVAARRQIEFPRGHARVNVTTATVTVAGSKGVNGVRRGTTDDSLYCFDLTFAPRVAVASANINNNATVGTVLGRGVPSTCPAGVKGAAARTHAADTSAPSGDINFGIVFI